MRRIRLTDTNEEKDLGPHKGYKVINTKGG